MINKDKICALNMRIDELQIIAEILEDLRNDPSRDPVDLCREKEIDFGRFLHYAGDLDLVKGEINTIEDLGLHRAYYVLKRAGINTISELAQLTVSDIIGIRNMGFISAAEIVKALAKIGITILEGPMNPEEMRRWTEVMSDRR